MNSFLCLSRDEVFVVEIESPPNYSVRSVVNFSVNKCYALSPDNLYLASCDKNRILTIRNVDNGNVLQTLQLTGTPEACWWSELYLWVICKGKVAKYPYDSTQTKMMGSCVEEPAVSFESVLKFSKGVLVIRLCDNEKISILKIRNQKIYLQQIPDSNFNASSVAISSDGCAVLLYRKSSFDYQLWEIECEDRWKISSTGKLDSWKVLFWFCLTGSDNSRSSVWLTSIDRADMNKRLSVFSISFPSCQRSFLHQLSSKPAGSTVIYADSNILILHNCGWIYFVNLSNSKMLNSLYVGLFTCFKDVSSFYIPSRAILVLAGEIHLHFFKIHNVEGNLPSIGSIDHI
jgi:hypothetical protein